jgi:tetratricopeptide (TPR) repeat protein
MKRAPLFAALLFLAPAAHGQQAPAPAPADAAAELLPAQREFLNLPEERRREFFKHIGRAGELFGQKRIFETLDELAKAEAVFANSPELLNLKGSCYVELRNFDKALACFQEALDIAPGNVSIEFNVAEVMFVTKQWQKAHDLFTAILAKAPKENMPLARIVEFKILLCKKKLGQHEEAAQLAEKYDFFDDSPYHFYAQAALAYEAGDLVKAEEWIARANRVFQNPAILAPWQDTLVEYGYIKSFYGNDEADAQ